MRPSNGGNPVVTTAVERKRIIAIRVRVTGYELNEKAALAAVRDGYYL